MDNQMLLEQVQREIERESSPEPEEIPETTNFIDILTDEALLFLFTYFNKVDLSRCNTVCKRWRKISSDRTLWKSVNFSPVLFNVDHNSFNILLMSKMKFTEKIYLGSLRVSFKMFRSMVIHCKHLRTLVFGRNSTIEEPPSGRFKIHFPKYLQNLDIRLANGKFQFLNEMQTNFAHLQNFGVSANSFDGHQLYSLFDRLPALKVVDFTNCNQMDDRGVEALANSCRSIKSLCLIGCRNVHGTSFELLIDKCSNLKTLLLRYLRIRDDIISQSFWSRSNLEELDISACPDLTWHGLYRLLPQLRSIEYLNMSFCGEGNAVTDTVLSSMTTSGSIKNLKMLDIRWSFYITSRVLDAFFQKCPQLRYLGIYQSSNIYCYHLHEMIQRLPKMKIIEYGGSYPQELNWSHFVPQLTITTKDIEVLSLINFTADQDPVKVYKTLKYFARRCVKLKRINLCDCSNDLIEIAKKVLKENKRIELTVKWECALPPPKYTLDSLTLANS